jgi:hypothetical protein
MNTNKVKRLFLAVVLGLTVLLSAACNNPISDVVLDRGGHNCPAEKFGGHCDN